MGRLLGMGSEKAIKALREFVEAREWKQFHTRENLAKSISIEAAELLELFQWDDNPDEERLREELADVLAYCLHLADDLDIDIDDLVLEKIAKNELKYPVEKSRGKSNKYDRL
jgi:NTP pyrophosphatase (non-canonical NTP hydrolase)